MPVTLIYVSFQYFMSRKIAEKWFAICTFFFIVLRQNDYEPKILSERSTNIFERDEVTIAPEARSMTPLRVPNGTVLGTGIFESSTRFLSINSFCWSPRKLNRANLSKIVSYASSSLDVLEVNYYPLVYHHWACQILGGELLNVRFTADSLSKHLHNCQQNVKFGGEIHQNISFKGALWSQSISSGFWHMILKYKHPAGPTGGILRAAFE